ncbi:hypothetical protein AQUCO_06100074v1 [Aquilegia coerulea]|uniref:F-box domain-containing protein n=1 Tax=Aquilegia coerulea TaxID=218851 RepID=A0A2G5CDE5_AQUCA|nr:hypothetical protein AQUCO_06100074v1 [Aquilegia coerulea]
MDHLPSEITAQILSMLPVRSVLRCKYVCKTRRNLIDDPKFADLHFTKSSFQLQESERLVDLTNFKAISRYLHGIGCGFDHTNKKLKLVVIYNSLVVDGSNGCITEAQVFTLGSDLWIDLKNVPQVQCLKPSATVQGSIHWLTYEFHFLRILSFDLASENFSFLELPKCYLGKEVDVHEFRIMNFGGDLSVVDFSYYYDRIEIWVMKEYGVKESWTKHTIMRTDSVTGVNYSRIYPISPWKNGEILLLNDGRKLISYNLETGMYTLFQIDGFPEDYYLNDVNQVHRFEVHPYVGNLLSVQPED